VAIYALSIKHKAKGKGATARAHAEYIAREGKYKNLEVRQAKSHSEYLTREGKYQNRAQELERTWSGNMPKWAKTPKEFWEAADTFERANGRVYTEVVIALPRELSKGGREKVVNEFIDREVGDRFTYTVAIHNPKAMDGGEQPHAHVMFSVRERDGIEREKELYFKRANPNHPELGGAKKSREWSMDERSNDRVNEIRVSWEELANKALKREGHEVRIDRRTLEAQGIDREPEPKMGPEVTQRLKRGLETEIGGKVIELRNYRKQELELNELERELLKERGRVLQFGEPVKELEQENVLTFTKVRRGQKVSEEEQRRYQRTLDLVLDRKDLGDGQAEYRWKRSGRLAFTDQGDQIVFNNISETAVKAGLQLAKQKGWEGVKVSGSIEFRRENWIQCQIIGYSISGFMPEERDFDLLNERKKVEELNRSRYREKEAPSRERKMEAQEHERHDSREKEYNADDLEKQLRAEIIPVFEERKKALVKEMRKMGFDGSPDDPNYYHYKIQKGFPDLPSDGELRAKAFEIEGGESYKQMKAQRGKALTEVLEYEKKLLELEKKQNKSILKKFSPGHILEKKRLGAELKQAERWASDAKLNIEDDELRLSTGRKAGCFNQTMSQLVSQRSATEERRAALLKEHGEVSQELTQAHITKGQLKRLGHTKVRAICERGKVPQVNEREIRQKTREIEEIERVRERSLGYDRGR
jgi:hypothetical protein